MQKYNFLFQILGLLFQVFFIVLQLKIQMMKKYIVFVFVITVVSCKLNSKKEFEKLNELSWLLGKWENKLGEGKIVENWNKTNDSVYTAESFFIKGKDTLHVEKIVLIQNNDDVFYIATVQGQNMNQPVEFKLNQENEGSFSFENPTHDYPQKIEYKKVTDSQMSATVSGKQEGKINSDTYILNKK